MATKKQKPAHEVRLGRVKAVIWENRSGETIFHNVTFTRLYKDGDDWKESSSFSRDDLPLVQKVADQVHTWIYDNMKRQVA